MEGLQPNQKKMGENWSELCISFLKTQRGIQYQTISLSKSMNFRTIEKYNIPYKRS